MIREACLNIKENESLTAIMEDGDLVEVYMEQKDHASIVGNIYKGKVANILPGMQAAFVDIGLEKNAFLYVNDAVPREMDANGNIIETKERIEKALRVGQELMVQITKEPIGNKGARITTHITVPGRFAVLMPTVKYIGISRRIEDLEERERLRGLALNLVGSDLGIIIRTAATKASDGELSADFKYILKLWKRLQGKFLEKGKGNLLYSDTGAVQKLVRDLIDDSYDAIVVNDAPTYQNVIEMMEYYTPNLKDKVKIFHGDMLNAYEITGQLAKANHRKVWLNCGGYLIIDHTEALTVIDVNTGKFIGNSNLMDTVLQANVEAAVEIAKQMRLRNIGGIVVVDFIDMRGEDDRNAIIELLNQEIKKDRVKVNILGFTQLGLLELTRKKNGRTLGDLMMSTCPTCSGAGRVLSAQVVYTKVRSEICLEASRSDAPTLYIEANPAIAAYLIGPAGANMAELEAYIGKKLIIRGNDDLASDAVMVRGCVEDEFAISNAPVKVGEVIELKITEGHQANANDGIGKINGFVIAVMGAGDYLGEVINVEITKVAKTFASGIIFEKLLDK